MTDARLPRGRHKLPREDVRSRQRERILAALQTTMAERGYADTPVSAILRTAGVSRETFYELFDSKADCFTAALDETITLLAGVVAPTDAARAPIDVLADMLERYLQALTAAPALARLFLLETYAAGPDAVAARLALQGGTIDRLAALFGLDSPTGRLRAEAFVGVVVALVTTRVVDPSQGTLIQLHPALLDVARRVLGDQSTGVMSVGR